MNIFIFAGCDIIPLEIGLLPANICRAVPVRFSVLLPMPDASSYSYIVSACILVILSYLYNLFSKKTGIPSVLLLLLTGIGIREALIYFNASVKLSSSTVELFGILGLIMIVLEAGLDLQIGRKKLPLIRKAFFSAFIIFIISAATCSMFLYFYLDEAYLHCLIYAIPLSIVSSAIVIPSISHLQEIKKEFLVYETSFSDIIGIMLFNYIIAGNLLKAGNIALFFGSSLFAVILSIVLSIGVLFILTHITTRIRFFLVFAILIFLYSGGKMLHLPSLFIILLFGLLTSNWHLVIFQPVHKWIPPSQVREVVHLLHALTAESSFLIRTFFFVIFGLTIDLRLLMDSEVILAGSALLLLLFIIRYIYLRFFLRSHIFPELFFMPRGLITVLLFYSIPDVYKLSRFNEGILFFVILTSAVIMMIGTIGAGKPQIQIINDDLPITDNS